MDGFRVSDLMPAQTAVLENVGFATRNGLVILAVLLGISLIPRMLGRFLSASSDGGFFTRHSGEGSRGNRK